MLMIAEKMTKRKRIEKEVVAIPEKQATITLKEYKNAIGLKKEGNAYLEVLSQGIVKNMHFNNGTINMQGILSTLTDQDIEKLRDTEVEKIDLTLLRAFYTIILKECEKSNFQYDISDIKLYIPDLLKVLGLKSNRSQGQIGELLLKINELKNLIGVIRRNKGGRIFSSFYAVINVNYYDEEKNIISLSAPYLNVVAKLVLETSIRCDKNGKKLMKKNGCPNTRASHSYLISLHIGKERNKAAVENVNIIVALIEMAGGTSAHISAETIVSRNVLLQKRLDECLPKNRNQILGRVFKKTWKLLKAKTDLESVYPDIELPDPNDLKNIPTMQTLSKAIFNFPHDKKMRKNNLTES